VIATAEAKKLSGKLARPAGLEPAKRFFPGDLRER
jgi:hypothetical protein